MTAPDLATLCSICIAEMHGYQSRFYERSVLLAGEPLLCGKCNAQIVVGDHFWRRTATPAYEEP